MALGMCPVTSLASVVGYFIGDESAELGTVFCTKHEHICRSRNQQDAGSEVRPGPNLRKGFQQPQAGPSGQQPHGTGPLVQELFPRPVKTHVMRKKLNGSKTQREK